MNDVDLLKRDLMSEIDRCKELFNSNVFVNDSIFTQSAFIEILIRLNYVLQELYKNNNRLIWNDDIKNDQNIKDITDLVCKLRNAACHSDSGENYINNDTTGTKFVFNTIKGKCPAAFQIGQIFLGNDYENDIAFYYGDKRIYLVRHIKRLLEELPSKINEIK